MRCLALRARGQAGERDVGKRDAVAVKRKDDRMTDRFSHVWRRVSHGAVVGFFAVMIAFAAQVSGAAADPVTPPWRDQLPAARPHTTVDVDGNPVDATLAV